MSLFPMGDVQACQIPGCDCDRGVRYGYRGWFCQQHYARLFDIRSNLVRAKMSHNLDDEIHWRMQEMLFRHHTDAGHWHALCYLVGQVTTKQVACMYFDMLHRLRLFLEASPYAFVHVASVALV